MTNSELQRNDKMAASDTEQRVSDPGVQSDRNGNDRPAGGRPGGKESEAETEHGHAPESESGGKLQAVQILGSVLAAGLGVQSSKNRERDFKQGNAKTFIVAGLIFTALFIGAVYTVVSIVLSNR